MADLDSILASMVRCAPGVSDLHFAVGQPPMVEANGRLMPAAESTTRVTPEVARDIADDLLGGDDAARRELDRTGSCDFGHTTADGTRFRVNVFRVRGEVCVVLRALPGTIPTLERLRLPSVLRQIPQLQSGLVLVTGATGAGKSTTLAALIDAINTSRPVHILTLEDPIEFSHPHKTGTVNQREKGRDFASFAGGMRAALRQAAKVILVGEMRDRETVEIALKAAETGHLVLSSLHTIDAGQTIHRVAGMFAPDEQALARSRLAQVLRFVVAQRLLPRTEPGRVAALEIMGSNLRVRELIEHGENGHKTFRRAIADSRPFGWQTFDQHISELYASGVISEEVAHSYSSDRAAMRQQIDRVQSARGEETHDLGELELDTAGRVR